jgi:outer membrane protein, multidrug efflux system
MLSACILTAERPDIVLEAPPPYRAGRGTSAPPALDWWRGFRSGELTRLVEEAQANNADISVAIARIIEADALSKVAGAPLLPTLTANLQGLRSRPSQTTGAGGTGAGGPAERELYTAVLNASYEIDFWGKNRAASLAAERGGEPLQQGSRGALDRRVGRQYLFPGIGLARPASGRAQ